MQENYLAKWLNNELTEEELTEFKKSDEYVSYQRIIKAADTLKAPDFNADEAHMALKNKQILGDSKAVQLHPFKRFIQVAAAVAVLVIGSYFFLSPSNNNVTTEYAENKEVVLPDMSKVIMNADSEITYNEKNWAKERNISLDGEAFFKVAKGKRFTVSTENGIVAVLGTQFNVENRKDFFEVTCFEGLVSVTLNGEETKLPAGTSFMVISGKIVETVAPDTSVPTWMNKESTFKSIPLKYVLDEFERQHNLEIEIQNIDIEQLYTGTFSNTDTDLALKSISVPLRIKFKFEGNKVLFYAEDDL